MKKTTLICAVLAGTFGFSTLASAQDWRGGRDRDGDQRTEQRRDRGDRNDRHDRHDRRDNDRNWRQDRHDNRSWNDQHRHQQHGYVQSQPRGYVYNQPRHVYTQPQHVYNQPQYVYTQPNYSSRGQRYHRGGYVPRHYLSNQYYVNNWQSYPGLYSPPYGHQWVNTGGEFLLVALATGLIANALLN